MHVCNGFFNTLNQDLGTHRLLKAQNEDAREPQLEVTEKKKSVHSSVHY